jgi:hypothetical protein
LNLYVHTPGNGWWYRSFSFTEGTAVAAVSAPSVASSPNGQPIVAVEKPFAGENVGILTQNNTNTISIKGFAFDPNATPAQGSGVDHVEVWINGPRGQGGTLLGTTAAYLPDAQAAMQYGSQWTNTGWSISFTPTSHPDGYTLIYVYAHSALSRQWVSTKEAFNIVEGTGD